MDKWINNLEELVKSDVIVCGGGPAGLAAALAAARNGAEVVLLEQSGALGGMASIGLVPMLAYTSDGVNITAAGVCMEIAGEVVARMGIGQINPSWQSINPEIFKKVCDEKVTAAGINVYFSQKIAAVERDGDRVTAVAVAGPRGLKRITGKVFVDATGDAAVSAFAGVPFECGDATGKTMSPSLCVQYAGIDWDEYLSSEKAGRNYQKIWHELMDAGKAPLPERHFVGIFKTGPSVGTGNLGHIYGVNGINETDVTRGYIEGREIAGIIHRFFREHVPGFRNSELVNTASLLSVRETRRITGDYCLNFKDYLRRAVFPDEIGRYSYPVDIHSSSTDAEEQKRVEDRMQETSYQSGENYGIPYRAMLPKGISNLLVAGRSISCDREVQSSLRVMPACFITGQAAGTAAALSLSRQCITRAVKTDQLRAAMRDKLGAYLP
ncbi:MAG: FAD-dependent oxidoreductase [Victivallaceae bacterium]